MNQTGLSNGINTHLSAEDIASETARYMGRVYWWMTIGILLSAAVSWFVANTPDLTMLFIGNKMMFYGLLIAQLAAVFSFSILIKRISATMAMTLFLTYATLSGITFSVIFFAYTMASITNVFVTTAFGFAGLSAFGYFTKRDLGPVGTFCGMALWGLIGFAVVSMFMPSVAGNAGLQNGMSIIGLLVFAGLTAYDTQKIKAMNVLGNEGTDEDTKEAIHGALILYLDFVNMFLFLLRLMGRRK